MKNIYIKFFSIGLLKLEIYLFVEKYWFENYIMKDFVSIIKIVSDINFLWSWFYCYKN